LGFFFQVALGKGTFVLSGSEVQILVQYPCPSCDGLRLVIFLLMPFVNANLGNSPLFQCDSHIRKSVTSCCRKQLRSIGTRRNSDLWEH